MLTTKKNSCGKPTWKENAVDPFHLHEKHHNNKNSNSYSLNVRKLLKKHSSNEVFEFAKNIFDGILMKANAEKCNKAKMVKLKGIADFKNPEHDLIITIRNSDGVRVVLHNQLSQIKKEMDMEEQVPDSLVTVDKADEIVKDCVTQPTDETWAPYFGMRRNNSVRRKPLERSRTLPLKENSYDNYSLHLQRRHTYERSGTKKKLASRDNTTLEGVHFPRKISTSVFDNKGFEASPDEAIDLPSVLPNNAQDTVDPASISENIEEPSNVEADDKTLNSCWERHMATMRDNGSPCPRTKRTPISAFSRRVDNFHMFGCKQKGHLTRTPTFRPGLGCGFLEYPYAEGTHTEIRCA